MLRRAVGYEQAAAMLLAGEVLDGETAERRGLVWRCVDDEALLDTAKAMAAGVVSGPLPLVKLVKDSLQQSYLIGEHDKAVDFEIERQLWSQEQPYFKERLAAIQKRITKK